MRILVTAGPTREPLDPVRYLSNRSSGKMGFALAEAADVRGHDVCLIAGPVHLTTQGSVTRVDVVTAEEMYAAVADRVPAIDVAILSAAVADYRPRTRLPQKMKKSGASLLLELEPTPDILGSMRRPLGFTGFLVGFAAETEHLLLHAQEKLKRKDCDLLVANDVSQPHIGFDSEQNAVTLLYRHGAPEILAQASKRHLADVILDRIEGAVSA